MKTLHFLGIFWLSISLSANLPILNKESITHPKVGLQGMVVTQHYLASEVGESILSKGGNAYDATIAVAFALAVVLPRAGNIGGGGFTVLYNSSDESFQSLDYREKAPLAASKNMYLDNNGDVISNLSTLGYKAIAVPGTVDGMWELHKKYGSMDWKELILPAIKLAKQGFRVSPLMADTLNRNYESLSKFSETKKIFFQDNPVKFNSLLIQKDLAKTLEKISNDGRDGFYQGDVARKIVADMKRNDGLITLDDLENYKSKWRKPLINKYKNFEIITMPPPSSGGLHLIQMLNILESFDIKSLKHNSPSYVLLLNEVMKYAYADRSQYLGDPDYVDVPVKKLISKDYAEKISKKITIDRVTQSDDIKAGMYIDLESDETTHFSIADKFGNLVSTTYTLNSSFGSKVVIAKTGILMNNEMDDFSSAPGVPNQFGLLGEKFNEIQPSKRPLSSMTPTIVFKNNSPFLIMGSPGGSRIITAVLQNFLNIAEFDMNLADSINKPRVHQQWYPDLLFLEKGFDELHAKKITELGQEIYFMDPGTALESIMIKNNYFYGYGDTRRPDSKAIGVNGD
jgi:gamma-glutamyltranspeptidase/glutathione hydrolase